MGFLSTTRCRRSANFHCVPVNCQPALCAGGLLTVNCRRCLRQRRYNPPPMLNKNLGQHFLRDEAVCAQILAALAPATAQTILEIGAGGGALTDALAHSGAQVVALEVDERFVTQLRTRHQDNPRVRIVHADALTADWQAVAGTAAQKVRLVGNLPYYISSPLLLKMAQHAPCLQDCHIMVQQEVAERVCAAPGGSAYGRLTVSLQIAFRAELLFSVPPAAFTPPPQVESAVVRLLPQPQPQPSLPPCFWQVLAAAFSQRRKTLKNALATLPMAWADCPVSPQRRAQTLSVEEFVTLAQHCAPAAEMADSGANRRGGKGI